MAEKNYVINSDMSKYTFCNTLNSIAFMVEPKVLKNHKMGKLNNYIFITLFEFYRKVSINK